LFGVWFIHRERAAAAAKQQNKGGVNLDLSALIEEDADDMAEFSDEDFDEDEEYVEVSWRRADADEIMYLCNDVRLYS
jgi:hypothetical protein